MASLGWIALVLVACATPEPSSSWNVRRAEQLRADGKFEEALRFTDRQIAIGHTVPSPELAVLHTSLLNDVGRNVEAEAYAEFITRYFGGEETHRPNQTLEKIDCDAHQAGLNLIHSWATPRTGRREIGVIIATFEINKEGKIGSLVIESARDAASAWGAIDSIARARVHDRRFESMLEDHPDRFPLKVCLNRNFDPNRDPGLGGSTIRGNY